MCYSNYLFIEKQFFFFILLFDVLASNRKYLTSVHNNIINTVLSKCVK